MLSFRPGAWLVFLLPQVAILSQTTCFATDDLETIRSRLTVPLLVAANANSVGKLIDSMNRDGTWSDIDYDSKSRSAWPIPTHLSRVTDLAQAYRAPKSDLHGDRAVLAATLRGLDAWLRLDPQNPNWWWNQIGVPRTLLPILLLLDDDLSDSQREAGLKILRRAKIGMTGQNLVWVAEVTAGRGLLENDADLVAAAYRRIADEIRVSTKEGIQPDFSFHQHGPCLYSHGYGSGFIVDCARIAARVDATTMAFPPEKIELLAHLILDGTQWMTRGDATDFGGEGREITRKGQSTRHLVGAAKYMLQLKTGREEEFRALAARATGRLETPPLFGNRHFWRADLMTHHRPKYYASARMHSKRLANTDGPANSEGLLSHHLADGCFVLMQTGSEYRDIYGVWDWQKIPGTTVRQKPELKGSPRRMGTTEFAGGVSDGTYGMAAYDFERSGLVAKKSWFFFDDEIVCLGVGIDAAPGSNVVTTLNQCYLKTDVAFSSADDTKILDKGNHVLETPKWIWHDSVAYVFLDPAELHLRNDAKSGTWHASNRRYPDRQETHDLFTAWIDHGNQPHASHYGYVVIPGVGLNATADRAAHVYVRVLVNSEQLQAVTHDRLELTAAAFYEPGRLEVLPGRTIEVDKPCLLLAHKVGEELRLTLANPVNKATEVTVVVSSSKREQSIVISLPGGLIAGSSVTKKLAPKPSS